MRRAERAVEDPLQICKILDRCRVLHLGMHTPEGPYVVPLNFGYAYENGAFSFVFHCAHEGRKLDCLALDPRVCVEVDGGHALIEGTSACVYGFHYQSVIGFGRAERVTDPAEKACCLSLLMRHQTGRDFSFTPAQAAGVTVCRVSVHTLTAKAR